MEHVKPKLGPEAQIEHLKRKGVGFNVTGEEEALRYLAEKNTYFKLASYRKLFPVRRGGAHDGEYAGLEFAYLQDLASIDQHMRYAFLPMTLDIEHFAKVKIVNGAGSRDGEDCYSIVADYLSSLSAAERKRREQELVRARFDPCNKGLVDKYLDDMPVWVLTELVSFGTLMNLYLFCAERWGDFAMKKEFHLLRQTKAVRNLAAHSSNLLLGIASGSAAPSAPRFMSDVLAQAGIGKCMRKAKMSNLRLQQIATFLYAYDRFVVGETSRDNAVESIAELREKISAHASYYERNDMLRSSFDFLNRLFDIWF